MTEPTLVLMHSPLVGPVTSGATAECLTNQGYGVAVPWWVGVAEQGPPYYRRLAEAAARHKSKRNGVGPVLQFSSAQ